MAALRWAARRLGDQALQRLQQAIYKSPAVQEAAQRRLLRTVAPACPRRAASSRAATANPPTTKVRMLTTSALRSTINLSLAVHLHLSCTPLPCNRASSSCVASFLVQNLLQSLCWTTNRRNALCARTWQGYRRRKRSCTA